MKKILLLSALAIPLCAQSPLQLSVNVGGTSSAIPAGGSVALTANDLGQPIPAVVTVRYAGSATASVTGISLSGSTELTLVGSPALPAVLNPGGTTTFTVQYNPSTGNAVAAQVMVAFTESGQASTFGFSVTGTSPRLSVSYFVSPSGNVTDLVSGDRISYPATNLGSSTTAVINILNRGTATGSLRSVVISGGPFQVTGLNAPVDLAPGQVVAFSVIFTPNTTGGALGLLTLKFVSTTAAFTLSGTGTNPDLAVSYALSDGNSRPLPDGSLISFPSVDVNGSTSATITVLNQGSGAGSLTAISVGGAGFQISGAPQLPANIPFGQSVRFNIVFNPTQSGSFSGNFRIDLSGRSITGSLAGSTTSPNFTITYAFADNVVQQLPSGATIVFPSVDINGTNTATITVSNPAGAGAGQITGISVTGSAFRLTGAPALPLSVPAGQLFRFGIAFAPTQSGTFTGTFRIDLTGRTVVGTLSGSTAAARFTLSYIDPDTNNALSLPDTGTLQFPNTLINSSTTLTLIATNTGAGTGSVNAFTLGGAAPSAFQVLNLPALPVSIAPNQQLRFNLRFTPQLQQSYTATLAVNFNGEVQTINLVAQGAGPFFTYTTSTGGNPTVVNPGGTIAVADTSVGQTTSMTLTVTNSGSGDGQIAAITITGQGLSLTSTTNVPFTLKPNAVQEFKLNFAPTQPGAVTGKLTIGADTFTIAANALGSRLIYSYNSASDVITVADGGVVIFPPIAVGNSETLDITVQNTGTTAANLSTINLGAPSTVFSLLKLPALPMSLNPGASVTFTAAFQPNNTGGLTAALRINNALFTLSGAGAQPAALPSYQFQGPSGAQQPAQQPSVGLTLSSPYAMPLQGTLKLSFVSSVFTDDPSVQFASGGRTVAFTIPANSTKAVFTGNASSMPIQTGTTAGTIVITPSFATNGGFDLTPPSADTLTLTVPRAVPQLLNASITAQTTTSFTVVLTGYSTVRALKQLDINISPKQGETFTTTHLTLDVSNAASSWYGGAASQAFGGSFLVAIPFSLANGSTGADLVHLLQSLSITATNDVGTSSAVSVTIP